MVDGENDAVLEVLGGKSTIETHGEGFFGDEAFAEFAKSGAFAGAGFGERFGFRDGGERFFVKRMASELVFCGFEGIGKRMAGKKLADDEGEGSGGKDSAGMAVGESGEIVADIENVGGNAIAVELADLRMSEIHAERSNAHDAAAAFAVVGSASDFAAAGLQSGEARRTGSAPGKEFFLLKEPAGLGICRGNEAGVFLGHEPAGVGGSGGAKEVGVLASDGAGDVSGENGFGGEEGHLGVVGDSAEFSVGRNVIAKALLAVSAEDFVEVEEFDGSAQSIADRPTEQASTEASLDLRVGWSTRKGHFKMGSWERLARGQDTAKREKASNQMRNCAH